MEFFKYKGILVVFGHFINSTLCQPKKLYSIGEFNPSCIELGYGFLGLG